MAEIIIFPGLQIGGWCIDCLKRIDPRRLAVLPAAKRCTKCQSAHTAKVAKTVLPAELIPVVFRD